MNEENNIPSSENGSQNPEHNQKKEELSQLDNAQHENSAPNPAEKHTAAGEDDLNLNNPNEIVAADGDGVNLPETNAEVLFVMNTVESVKQELRKVIVGQEGVIEMLIAALLSNGHVLLEGVPGVAKTLLVKLTAQALDCDFSRIQFTPDLMPSDIIGTSILNMKTSEFEFRKGPVFSNFILIDEINRAPAKTQAALFEVMEERQITSDNHTYDLGFPLFIIATQNPIEQEGTYKLPEAQLDRFLFKLKLGYPTLDQETQILGRFKDDFGHKKADKLSPVLAVPELKKCTEIVEKLHIKPELVKYIAELVNSTRDNGDLYLGASPRASLAILRSSKALAAMRGRSFVTPDDIRDVAVPVLNHRILLSAEKELEGKSPEEVINELTSKIEVPR